MSLTGASSQLIRSRAALLNALEALFPHLDSIVVIGAQAVYIRTGDVAVAIEPSTKDSDIALDPTSLGGDPLLEDAMRRAGFVPDPDKSQPGT